ncbi:MAG TPA: M1 family aminopeptidase [Pseudobdellovibrionaceae bacterium]|nr:M1 family aminopeptidase [Pseudobdellovibrionaceae bacterium]
MNEASEVLVHHNLQVEIHPERSFLSANEILEFSTPQKKIEFSLNKNLKIDSINGQITSQTTYPHHKETVYVLEFSQEQNSLHMIYSGVLLDPVIEDSSTGLITESGVSLFGSSYWYPNLKNSLLTFELSVNIKKPWEVISQGFSQKKSEFTTHWKMISPQDEILIIAADFKKYELNKNNKNFSVFLRTADPLLAKKFLEITPDYIQHYTDLIGKYPYNHFYVVENFWETGFGMPGFTLLGPSVLRLPFIFNSSYPHEILHNWWGNGVFVEPDQGNWCEGLTTYMADHWQQEKILQDAIYRQNGLTHFMDFVNSDKDFPLREFIGRNNPSTQAVGYGKSMMFFHMLKIQFGEDVFYKALQHFYTQNLFKRASFKSLQNSFEIITNQPLESLFSQWLDRTGMSKISLHRPRIEKVDQQFDLKFELQQKHTRPYELTIPLRLTLADGSLIEKLVSLTEDSKSFHFSFSQPPQRLEVDPDFDVFRELYPEEKPASLSNIFSSQSLKVYYTSPFELSEAREFLVPWVSQFSLSIEEEDSSQHKEIQLPERTPTLLWGDALNFRQWVSRALKDYGGTLTDDYFEFQNQRYSLNDHALVLVLKNPKNNEQPILWIHTPKNTPTPYPFKEWSNRLTHYGKFSLLIFKDRPNILKTQWNTKKSPLVVDLKLAP